MGGCVSSAERQYSSSSSCSAKVVSVKGDLREYPVPMTTVSQVLQMEISSSSSSSSSSCFVCNSDRLYYDDYIKALEPEEELEADQIYFVLPNTKLQYRLSASDMAALAVKATVALQTATTLNNKLKKRSWRKKGRISPILFHHEADDGNHHQKLVSSSSKPSAAPTSSSSSGGPGGVSVSRSGSVRKLQRYSSSSSTSRRAKLAVRSFRVRLTTIYEGTVLHFY